MNMPTMIATPTGCSMAFWIWKQSPILFDSSKTAEQLSMFAIKMIPTITIMPKMIFNTIATPLNNNHTNTAYSLRSIAPYNKNPYTGTTRIKNPWNVILCPRKMIPPRIPRMAIMRLPVRREMQQQHFDNILICYLSLNLRKCFILRNLKRYWNTVAKHYQLCCYRHKFATAMHNLSVAYCYNFHLFYKVTSVNYQFLRKFGKKDCLEIWHDVNRSFFCSKLWSYNM